MHRRRAPNGRNTERRRGGQLRRGTPVLRPLMLLLLATARASRGFAPQPTGTSTASVSPSAISTDGTAETYRPTVRRRHRRRPTPESLSDAAQTVANVSQDALPSNLARPLDIDELPLRSRRRLGTLVAVSLIGVLASVTTDFSEVSLLIDNEGLWDGYIAESVSHFNDAVLPATPSDIVTVTLGETIGGAVGAVVVTSVNFVAKTVEGTKLRNASSVRRCQRRNGKADTATPRMPTIDVNLPDLEDVVPDTPHVSPVPVVTRAIADGDYLIVRSASRSLFQSAGLPPSISSLASVLFAVIPSQLIKIIYQRQENLRRENEIMASLLSEQQQEQRLAQRKSQSAPFFRRIRSVRAEQPHKASGPSLLTKWQRRTQSNRKRQTRSKSQTEAGPASVSPSELQPVSKFEFDPVDVVSDIVKWLEYDILTSDLSDAMLWNGNAVDATVCGAVFGAVAGLSSLLYADMLYGVFRLGPEERQKEVRERQSRDWLSLYAAEGLSSAAIFGVYEGAKNPASRWIQGMLSGGFGGCVGSQDFDVCLQTYIDNNAPGPSFDAQIRALATNLAMVGERMHDIYADAGSGQEILAQFRLLLELMSQNRL